MTKQEILKIFEQAKNLEPLRKSIQSFIMDETNSFEDRLEVFVNTPSSMYSTDAWILHLPEFEQKYGDINWFEDFYFNRYELVNLAELVANKGNYGDTEDWSDEKFRDFQEAILNNGAHTFTLDW